MINLFSMILMGFGLFFFFVGTLGVLRFPDALTRAHGAAKCDTLGAVLCIVGLILQSGFTFTTIKLIVVIVFLWTTNPTATHMIAKAIYKRKD
ncbi:monovalent cation/H(+) antiporter subunit G [Fusibacter ferrireducens]|nr:monovalent cation/H(+) antiporter subunit G [Fusibacter ferrireducens]